MRVVITTVQVPFIRGGGELMADGLVGALRRRGVDVELVSMPFRFGPPEEVMRSMDAWAQEEYESADIAICLKFPTYYLRHRRRVVWLMHQHRSVYELFNTAYGESDGDASAVRLRAEVMRRDTESLRGARVFTIAARVSQRLALYNGISALELYHPPRGADLFYQGEQLPYIFAPSRLESLKRHELLIRAMPLVRKPIMAILVGQGGVRAHLERMTGELGLKDRIKFLDYMGFRDLIDLYANSLGVFFGPFDEDYGYVTLEAMLSSKPVVTCTDSGGPLEFVVHGDTGYVVEPTPDAIADCINQLATDPAQARLMGRCGKERIEGLGLSWDRVIDVLLEARTP